MQREKNANEKRSKIKSRQKRLGVAGAVGGTIAVGAIGVGIAAAASAGVMPLVVGSINTKALTDAAQAQALYEYEVAMQSKLKGRGGQNQDPMIHLRVQNVFVDTSEDQLSETALTCVWMGTNTKKKKDHKQQCLGRIEPLR